MFQINDLFKGLTPEQIQEFLQNDELDLVKIFNVEPSWVHEDFYHLETKRVKEKTPARFECFKYTIEYPECCFDENSTKHNLILKNCCEDDLDEKGDFAEEHKSELKWLQENVNLKFEFDSHWDCYCKHQKVCGCGCDEKHSGW